jgi:hypothetical protein
MIPKRLMNLKIREVSSVDRGAGEGVSVVLMKRDEDEIDVSDFDRAEVALHKSLSSIIADDELDDVNKQFALDETLAQYHEHIEMLKAKAKDQADGADEEDDAADDDGTPGMDETESSAGDQDKEPNRSLLLAHARAHRQRQRLMKQDDDMDSYIEIAKLVADGARSPITKGSWYNEITKRAAASRRADQTEAQAFAKYLETPDGKFLYSAFKLAPQREEADTAPTVVKASTPAPTPSYRKLMALADVLRKNDPSLSREQAFAKIYESSEHGELVEADKAERRAAAMTAQGAA